MESRRTHGNTTDANVSARINWDSDSHVEKEADSRPVRWLGDEGRGTLLTLDQRK